MPYSPTFMNALGQQLLSLNRLQECIWLFWMSQTELQCCCLVLMYQIQYIRYAVLCVLNWVLNHFTSSFCWMLQLERGVSSGDLAGKVEDIDFPPPRPKRKPSHPYPKKAGYNLSGEEVNRQPEVPTSLFNCRLSFDTLGFIYLYCLLITSFFHLLI